MDAWAAALAEVPLSDQPGTTHRYGIGMDVVGYIVAKVAGKGLDTYIAERIFAPLGMDRTNGWHVPDGPLMDDVAAWYLPNGDGGKLVAGPPELTGFGPRGGAVEKREGAGVAGQVGRPSVPLWSDCNISDHARIFLR